MMMIVVLMAMMMVMTMNCGDDSEYSEVGSDGYGEDDAYYCKP